jgi:hypothetical protein
LATAIEGIIGQIRGSITAFEFLSLEVSIGPCGARKADPAIHHHCRIGAPVVMSDKSRGRSDRIAYGKAQRRSFAALASERANFRLHAPTEMTRPLSNVSILPSGSSADCFDD